MSDQPAVNNPQAIDQSAAPANQTELEERQALQDLSSGKKSSQLSMNVRVYAPFREYYDGPAFSVSAENATGPFDVLPKHHSFISLLMPCDLVVRTVNKGDQKIRISGGIIHVKADQVIVFLDV